MLDREFGGSLEDFFAELNRESDRLIRTDLNQAQRLTKKTTGLETLLPDNYRAHLYRIWARHYHLSGKYPAAHRLYLKALELFGKLRDYNSRAKVQKALLDVFMYIRKYDEGIKAGHQSLKYYRRIGSAVDSAQVMTNLGNLYHRLDQNLKALDYYNRAFEIFKRLNHDYAMALVQFNRANVYANLNYLTEAERGYHKAAGIYRSLGMELAAAQVDYSLAYLAFLKGSYSESLGAFSRAADEFRRLGDEKCLALTELDLTEVNLQLNLYSQAIEDARVVADDFDRMGMSYEQGKAYYFAATGYYVFGDFDKAARLARLSLRLFKKEKNKPWQMLCRFLMARISCREKRYSAAIKAFREIAAFYRRQGDIRHYFDVRLAWLETLILSENRPAARRMINSFESCRPRMAGYQKFVYFMLAGDMNRQNADPTGAARYYRKAVNLSEKFRAAVFPDDIGRFFWMDKLAAYNRLASIYLEAGQKRRAFKILEMGKAASSITVASTPGKKTRGRIPARMKEEQLRLRANLRRALMPSETSARGMAAMSNIRSAEHRLWRIEQDLRKYDSPQRGYVIGAEGDIEDIRRNLKAGDILVRFVCREESRGIFVITGNDFDYISIDADIEEIRGLLSRFYFLINRVGSNGDDQEVLSLLVGAISRLIWHPLERKLSGCRRLFIVPDGILTRLPFYALDAGNGRTLCEEYDIYILSGLRDFIRRRRKIGEPGYYKDVSILAVSEEELPGSSLEALAVSRHFSDPKIFTGDRATARNFLKCMASEDALVHLVAHAAQSYENHLFSRILLSDGPLYPFDIISHPIRAALVVLSGCQTGDPGLYYYNDSLSLAQTILSAGAAEVIASYWPVADELTCELMDAFYRNLSQEANSYRALRQAILEMKSQTGDIRHWASFYLICRMGERL